MALSGICEISPKLFRNRIWQVVRAADLKKTAQRASARDGGLFRGECQAFAFGIFGEGFFDELVGDKGRRILGCVHVWWRCVLNDKDLVRVEDGGCRNGLAEVGVIAIGPQCEQAAGSMGFTALGFNLGGPPVGEAFFCMAMNAGSVSAGFLRDEIQGVLSEQHLVHGFR
jgi:hypothetical protein